MTTTTVPTFLDSDGLRALFITNECAGLGHLRRTINLARAVTECDPDATALIVTGSAALGSFVLPDRVDALGVAFVTLHNQTINGLLRCQVSRRGSTDLIRWAATTDVVWNRRRP
jgi:predicted glycosyltransferase